MARGVLDCWNESFHLDFEYSTEGSFFPKAYLPVYSLRVYHTLSRKWTQHPLPTHSIKPIVVDPCTHPVTVTQGKCAIHDKHATWRLRKLYIRCKGKDALLGSHYAPPTYRPICRMQNVKQVWYQSVAVVWIVHIKVSATMKKVNRTRNSIRITLGIL